MAMSGSAKEDDEEDGYYPGIVNISGTYCFMDSTLQVRRCSYSTVCLHTECA